jgi:bifunctional DNase/RNase
MAEEHEGEGRFDIPPGFFAEAYESGPARERTDWGPPVEVQLEGAFRARDEDREEHFVILAEGDARMAIVIGRPEWIAIQLALNGRRHDRPITHDLIVRLIESLDARVLRLHIDDEFGGTYYAKLSLESGGEEVEVDCRPSDGMAVALRAQAPIFVSSGLLRS